jgi:biopolymer transport protein ExbB
MNLSMYWQHTDLLSQSLFIILLVMSILTWCVLLLRILDTRQLGPKSLTLLTQSVSKLRPRMQGLAPEQRQAVAEQALLQQMARTRLQTERGLAVLGSIAAIAPFVGLFGTVWGIFHALAAIGQSGQAGLGQVAGPVGEALIMTGLGLAVAIPAVLGYNVCLRLNRRLMHGLHDQAHSILMAQVLPAVPNHATSTSNEKSNADQKSGQLAGSAL